MSTKTELGRPLTKKRGLVFERTATMTGRILVIAYIVLIIYPVIFVLNTSFKTSKEFYKNVWGLPIDFTTNNYPHAWIKGGIGSAFLSSVLVVGITVIVILVFAAMAGYALAKLKIPHAELLMLLLIALTMFPSESVLMPVYITMSRMNAIGSIWSLIIPYIGWGLPITIYIYKDFFATIPTELLESARMDGCSEFKVFMKIVVPLMLPATATCAIFNFVNYWGELLWATVALSTQSTLRTISMGVVEFKGQFSTDWGTMSASICIVLIPLVIFFLFTQKYFIQGLTAGSVKG